MSDLSVRAPLDMAPGGSPRPRSILEAGIASRRRGRFLAVGAAGFRGSFSQEVFGAARESVPATLGTTPEGSRASPPPPDPGISPRRRERVSDVVGARDARPRAGPQRSPKRVRPASWGKHRGVRRAARRLRRGPGNPSWSSIASRSDVSTAACSDEIGVRRAKNTLHFKVGDMSSRATRSAVRAPRGGRRPRRGCAFASAAPAAYPMPAVGQKIKVGSHRCDCTLIFCPPLGLPKIIAACGFFFPWQKDA